MLLLGQVMAFLIFTTGDIQRKCPRFAVWWRTVIHTTRWGIQILHQKIIKRKWKNNVKNKNEVPSNDIGQKEAKHEDMWLRSWWSILRPCKKSRPSLNKG